MLAAGLVLGATSDPAAAQEKHAIKVVVQVLDEETGTALPDVRLFAKDKDGRRVETGPEPLLTDQAGDAQGEVRGILESNRLTRTKDWQVVFALDQTEHRGAKVVALASPDGKYAKREGSGKNLRVRFMSLEDRSIATVHIVMHVTGIPLPCEWVLEADTTCGRCINGRKTCITKHKSDREGCIPKAARPPDVTKEISCCSWKKGTEKCDPCANGMLRCVTPYLTDRAGCIPPPPKPDDLVLQRPCECEWIPKESRGACVNDTVSITTTFVSSSLQCVPDEPQPEVQVRSGSCGCKWIPTETCTPCEAGWMTCTTTHKPSWPSCDKSGHPPDQTRRVECEKKTAPGVPDPVRTAEGALEIFFARGSADPTNAALDTLKSYFAAQRSGEHVVITGHADAAGSGTYNHQLALARANAIAHLAMRQGVAPDRVHVLVFGENGTSGLSSTGIQNRKATIRFYQAAH